MLRVWTQNRLSSKTRSGFASAHIVRVANAPGDRPARAHSPSRRGSRRSGSGGPRIAGGRFFLTSSQVGIGRRGVRAPLLLEPRLEFVERQFRPLRIAARRPSCPMSASRVSSSAAAGAASTGMHPAANLTASGGSGPPGFYREVEPEHDPVLEVAVGRQQYHRRDPLVAELLAEPGKQLVGDRRAPRSSEAGRTRAGRDRPRAIGRDRRSATSSPRRRRSAVSGQPDAYASE